MGKLQVAEGPYDCDHDRVVLPTSELGEVLCIDCGGPVELVNDAAFDALYERRPHPDGAHRGVIYERTFDPRCLVCGEPMTVERTKGKGYFLMCDVHGEDHPCVEWSDTAHGLRALYAEATRG